MSSPSALDEIAETEAHVVLALLAAPIAAASVARAFTERPVTVTRDVIDAWRRAAAVVSSDPDDIRQLDPTLGIIAVERGEVRNRRAAPFSAQRGRPFCAARLRAS